MVCFIPSDFALSAALDADSELLAFAANERVVIVARQTSSHCCGRSASSSNNNRSPSTPSDRRHREQVVRPDSQGRRTGGRNGRSLDTVVREYNTIVASIEGRLIPVARSLRSFGGVQRGEGVARTRVVKRLTTPLNEVKWGIDDDNALPAGRPRYSNWTSSTTSDIFDAE